MAFDFKNASKESLKAEYARIAKEIGDDQFFTKKELNYLPEILTPGEQILAFTSGRLNVDGDKSMSTCLITLTDKRIILLDKGMIYGLKQDIINLDKVNSISGSTGLMFGSITITEGAGSRIIENVWKKTVKIFTNKAQEAIDALKNNSKQSSGSSAPEDKYAKLEKLVALKEKGILSESEFLEEKRKILGS